MLTLAFDTSTSFGSVVLFENHKILFEKSWLREKSHSEVLTHVIDLAFQTSSRKPQDLKQLCVGIGPGSFTGIRVAVNVAKTLAFALNLKVRCIDSFDLLALGVDATKTDQNFLLGVIDAFNNELFFARYEKINKQWKRISKSQSKTILNLGFEVEIPHLCVGEAYDHYEAFFSTELKKLLVRDPQFGQFPSVENLVPKTLNLDSIGQSLAWNQVQALYIKASAAEEKLNEIKNSQPHS